MGFPPLVTPFSQYVKNAALVNVMQRIKGKERWSLLDDNTWDMLLGNAGQLPGKLSDELTDLAKAQNRDFFKGDPQELYPDALEACRKEMAEKGWDTGQDDEELLEYAMHTAQYIDYKSGKAKADFEADLAKKKTPVAKKPVSDTQSQIIQPSSFNVEVNGEMFKVNVSYDGASQVDTPKAIENSKKEVATTNSAKSEVLAPLEGKVFFTKESGEKPIKLGDKVQPGDVICYIESMKVINAIKSDKLGEVVEICFTEGAEIMDDDVLIRLN
jgi:pyruvate carboxylase subunit B